MQKKIYVLRLLILLLPAFIITPNYYAQEYYPLEIGNLWDYETISFDPMSGEIDTNYYSVQVIGDSLFSNGKKYFLLDRWDLISGEYIRADSSFVYYFDEDEQEEDTLFKLNANIGEIWYTDFRSVYIVKLEAIDTISFLGYSTRTLRFEWDGLAMGSITLSNLFGPISSTDLGDPPGNTQAYTLTYHCIIGEKEFGEPLVISNFDSTPEKFVLHQNYPNPFNPNTKIRFAISDFPAGSGTSRFTTLKVYDIMGNEVATLVNEEKPVGEYEIQFNATDLPSGIYFYQLQAGEFVQTKKLVLLK